MADLQSTAVVRERKVGEPAEIYSKFLLCRSEENSTEARTLAVIAALGNQSMSPIYMSSTQIQSSESAARPGSVDYGHTVRSRAAEAFDVVVEVTRGGSLQPWRMSS